MATGCEFSVVEFAQRSETRLNAQRLELSLQRMINGRLHIAWWSCRTRTVFLGKHPRDTTGDIGRCRFIGGSPPLFFASNVEATLGEPTNERDGIFFALQRVATGAQLIKRHRSQVTSATGHRGQHRNFILRGDGGVGRALLAVQPHRARTEHCGKRRAETVSRQGQHFTNGGSVNCVTRTPGSFASGCKEKYARHEVRLPKPLPCDGHDMSTASDANHAGGVNHSDDVHHAAGHILVVRHGESEWNVLGKWQGRADTLLTAGGRQQAVAAGEHLRTTNHPVQRVLASTLSRARETAEIIAAQLGITDVSVDERLVETDVGPWEGLRESQIEAGWPNYLRDRKTPPGFEPPADVFARATLALREAARDGISTLVVSHSGVIRTIRRMMAVHDRRLHNLEGRSEEHTSELQSH